MDQRSINEAGERSVHLQVNELRRLSNVYTASPTIFEPHRSSSEERDNGTTTDLPSLSPELRAPEKKLTLLALRLAILEKAATGLGTLGFKWATVVLLGGFAITIDKTDFWFITFILLIEGARIFSRSHELEWQHQATWSLTHAGINNFRSLKSSSISIWKILRSIIKPLSTSEKAEIRAGRPEKWGENHLQTRRWATSDVPLLPYAPWVFLSRNISKLLQWLQIAAALACVVLSLMKLIMKNFGDIQKGDTDKRNRKDALFIFYGLAFAEALLFLLEKLYWQMNVIHGEVLEKVNEECELGPSGIVAVKRFFYDAYSRCVDGSIFDGLKMDMVSFAMELLASDSADEQLIGARILRSFSTNERFSNDTLQKIGVTFSVVERLVEMLNWKDPQEEKIRQSAAVILSKLAGKKQNSLRVAGIPGSSINEIGEKSIVSDHEHYGVWTFNHLGLVILKKLARDHDNCGKIGNTRALLPKIIDFMHAKEQLLTDDNVTPSQTAIVKQSLQVIKMLASTTGETGKQLRKEISEIVFTMSNIREILRHGGKHPDLQKLGIEILTSLAMEDDATERIGATEGVLRLLLNIFFRKWVVGDHQDHVRTAAGEALAMLVLESENNSRRVLKLGALEKLVAALEFPLLRINAARVLRNLCSYSTEDCTPELRGITGAVPIVLKEIISEDNKLQEVMVGLAARAFKFMNLKESSVMFQKAGVKEAELANGRVQILKRHPYPATKFPRIRRFTIELAIWMMKDKQTDIRILKNLELERELNNVLDTTSEIEGFNIFSGTVGLSRFRTTMHSLVETALHLLKNQ
ncbi:hypothetical protein Cgig2_011600 [Carnegiea gigantea]|uniref:Uncharacterized protein n=1 Tax=Carnegiea gigantea TaxID=171969 RepID=A0A9Q1JHU2_9CARY|nr:hypothetical protein Cgig2_011600 [Carnegiea gigantea]